MNNHKTPKTAEDIIYDDVDDFNRNSFMKAAQNTLSKVQSLNHNLLQNQLQQYQESFRTYYYTSQILTDNKNNQFFEEALKEVHPSVKIKTPAKNILRLVSKVYLQELAQTCFELMQKTSKEDVDQEVVQDATRVLQKRRAKRAKFGKLFTQLN